MTTSSQPARSKDELRTQFIDHLRNQKGYIFLTKVVREAVIRMLDEKRSYPVLSDQELISRSVIYHWLQNSSLEATAELLQAETYERLLTRDELTNFVSGYAENGLDGLLRGMAAKTGRKIPRESWVSGQPVGKFEFEEVKEAMTSHLVDRQKAVDISMPIERPADAPKAQPIRPLQSNTASSSASLFPALTSSLPPLGGSLPPLGLSTSSTASRTQQMRSIAALDFSEKLDSPVSSAASEPEEHSLKSGLSSLRSEKPSQNSADSHKSSAKREPITPKSPPREDEDLEVEELSELDVDDLLQSDAGSSISF
ncbi:unnamed protein product, partial [Mesorhabditis spiculigera]